MIGRLRHPSPPASASLTGAMPTASVVSAVPVRAQTAIQTIPRQFPPIPTTPMPQRYSEAQPWGSGPISNAILRRWSWGWMAHRLGGPQFYGHTPIPIGPAHGTDNFQTAGGSIQAPRPRLTKVLRVPAYSTAPDAVDPSGPFNG